MTNVEKLGYINNMEKLIEEYVQLRIIDHIADKFDIASIGTKAENKVRVLEKKNDIVYTLLKM
jgi:hypothetical protein